MNSEQDSDWPHIFKTKERTIQYRFLEENFEVINSQQVIRKKQNVIEAFPNSWILFFFKNNWSAEFQIQTYDKTHVLNQTTAVFLPAFCLVRWKLNPGLNDWWAYRSTCPLPNFLSHNAFLCTWNSNWKFETASQLIEKLASIQSQATPLPSEFTNSDLARKIKKKIDTHFQEDYSLQRIIQPIDSSISTISHTFKKCYGLSPVKYRNQLRMHTAILNMSYKKKSVTQSCYDSGFNDFSRFFRNMKSYFNAKPSSFLPKIINK